MAERDERAAGMYLGDPRDKDRPWLYNDYLVLSWYVRERAPVQIIAVQMNRRPEEIERRIEEIPWGQIRTRQRGYAEWSRVRKVVRL